MVNEPGQVAARSRTLHALLLICAGALLVIVVTIASAISDAHSV